MPASPATSTSEPRPAEARAIAYRIAASPSARPTNGSLPAGPERSSATFTGAEVPRTPRPPCGERRPVTPGTAQAAAVASQAHPCMHGAPMPGTFRGVRADRLRRCGWAPREPRARVAGPGRGVARRGHHGGEAIERTSAGGRRRACRTWLGRARTEQGQLPSRPGTRRTGRRGGLLLPPRALARPRSGPGRAATGGRRPGGSVAARTRSGSWASRTPPAGRAGAR
jgi:hypothetical protein